MPVELTCLNCGIKFNAWPSDNRNFCSKECYLSSLPKKVEIICEYCGIVFEAYQWDKKRGRKFCSQRCYFGYNRGKKHPRYTDKIEYTCGYCGKIFPRYPSQLKGHQVYFCSIECKQQAHKNFMRGGNNPRYVEKIKLICKQCSQKFEVIPSLRNKIRFCSKECRHLWRENHPEETTIPEQIFLQICEKNNLPYRYTGDSQLWIGKTKKLNPDFVECNGKKIVIEIMGDYWHSPLLNPKLREGANLNYRKRHYKKYGWQSYFFWESDLKRPDAEEFVLSKLKGLEE